MTGMRSFHIRNARVNDPKTRVKRPVHILYYCVIEPRLIEIVRVLHERMEPRRHFGRVSERED
jgi:toxin ParE1/3/4